MEKTTLHYVHPTGFALGATSGVIYTACFVFVALLRERAVAFFDAWFHGVNLTSVMDFSSLGAADFFKGLIGVIVFAYLAGALYAWVYNACVAHCKKKGWM